MEIIEKVRTEDTMGFEWKLDDCWDSAKLLSECILLILIVKWICVALIAIDW